MNNKIKLSAVIITLNEERNIERCLLSLQNVVDEIVVVDSLSTDKTEEICRKYAVKFVHQKFLGYIEQKNFALTQASSDYVLSLDADEALSDQLKESILSIKNNWIADGYYFNRLNFYCGKWIKHTSWYPDQKLRLFNKTKGAWTGTNPHDCYKLQAGCIEKHIKGDLLHYTYYTVSDHIAQSNKFSEIQSQVFYNRKKSPSVFKMIVNPTWRFIRDYFIKLGFLDGVHGFIVCINAAHEVFLKYAKHWVLVQ
jgi:glycosyltransferase involved in cell wall biosynthesis